MEEMDEKYVFYDDPGIVGFKEPSLFYKFEDLDCPHCKKPYSGHARFILMTKNFWYDNDDQKWIADKFWGCDSCNKVIRAMTDREHKIYTKFGGSSTNAKDAYVTKCICCGSEKHFDSYCNINTFDCECGGYCEFVDERDKMGFKLLNKRFLSNCRESDLELAVKWTDKHRECIRKEDGVFGCFDMITDDIDGVGIVYTDRYHDNVGLSFEKKIGSGYVVDIETLKKIIHSVENATGVTKIF